MALMEIVVVPLGTETPSVSKYVADCVSVLKEKGLKFQVNPMGTVVEGDVDELLEVAKLMHQKPFEKGAKRVVTTLRIDDRKDKELHMEEKVKSVYEKLK
jgi:uncharacterized protein (TIGR00106 family)